LKERSLLITAEHASRDLPDRWAGLFSNGLAAHPGLLDSHLGWDPGSAELAQALARRLNAPLLAGQVTRLLVDLNRSERHPACFSAYTRGLPIEARAQLLDQYHRRHWSAFRHSIEQAGSVVHLACHSFTPVLDGRVRSTDLGLLYDPGRPGERDLAAKIISRLRRQLAGLRVHANQPYRGVSNGLGQQHRRHYSEQRLLSFELEVNTRLLANPDWSGIQVGLVDSLAAELA